MSKATKQSTAPVHVPQRKPAAPRLTAFRATIEGNAADAAAQAAANQRRAIFDRLSDLERAILDINGVAETLLRLGESAHPDCAVFAYLGHNLFEHHHEAREAFNRLHALTVKARE